MVIGTVVAHRTLGGLVQTQLDFNGMIDGAPLGMFGSRSGTGRGRPKPTDLYDAWLFAAADAGLALADWRLAARERRADAYAAYVAALDREEQAAVRLSRKLQ